MVDRPVISNLDFEEVKQDLVTHFKNRSEFSDYEFTGSSLNLLMDILSYNTHYYSLASNFLLNESFIESAILRKNVVSIAQRLNYTPRSVKAASTTVTLRFTKQNDTDTNIIIPGGSLFKSSAGNGSLTFHTIKNYVLQFETNAAVGATKSIDVEIYEGSFQTQSFTSNKDYTDFSKWQITQDNIDTDTMTVAVNGTQYKKVTPEDESLFNLSSDSRVYFLEENRDAGISIVFGNDIAGKAIKDNDQIVVSYLATNGVEGNGIKIFTPVIPSRVDAVIATTPNAAQGGAVKETISEIKNNAPKWFQAQYRAVTANDYEVILKNKFGDIQAISVWGGDEVNQPGKVFLCIKPKSADTLTSATKEIIKKQIIKSSNVVTVRPEIVDPRVFKLKLQTVVVFDESRLPTTRSVLVAKVQNLFNHINTKYVGDFLSSYRESNLSYEIKNLDQSVVSSNTRVTMTSDITATNGFLDRYVYEFGNKLYHPSAGFLASKGGILSSSLFKRENSLVESGFDDDGYGNIRLYDYNDNTKVYVNNKAGRIDYETGKVEFLYDFQPQNGIFQLNVVPDSVDVIATRDMILEIDNSNSIVTAVEIKETDLLRSINLNRST